ncbi:MAG: hypothetical protein D8M59_11900 [Planctomycetes bacterium]|nr:hypothetical protein [Planctomycetota bacterium]NOG55462.1 hypothetical protein [Planctomycetota bacterium]
MKTLISKLGLSTVGGALLTILVAFAFALTSGPTSRPTSTSIDERIFADGSREWRVKESRYLGVTSVVGICFPIDDETRNTLDTYEPPKWSGLLKPYSFTRGFQYNDAYGWPMRTLAWRGSLARDNGRSESLSIDNGIALVNDPNASGIAEKVIILPTVPIWLGLVVNTAFYTPLCWALCAVWLYVRRSRKANVSIRSESAEHTRRTATTPAPTSVAPA